MCTLLTYLLTPFQQILCRENYSDFSCPNQLITYYTRELLPLIFVKEYDEND